SERQSPTARPVGDAFMHLPSDGFFETRHAAPRSRAPDEKAQDDVRLRQRCEADLELATEAGARGDWRAERFYLYRAQGMIVRAGEIQEEVERDLQSAPGDNEENSQEGE